MSKPSRRPNRQSRPKKKRDRTHRKEPTRRPLLSTDFERIALLDLLEADGFQTFHWVCSDDLDGRVGWLISPGLDQAFRESDAAIAFVIRCFDRHFRCDWGSITPDEAADNDRRITEARNLRSRYELPDELHHLTTERAIRLITTIGIEDRDAYSMDGEVLMVAMFPDEDIFGD